jgi:zinc protease
MKENIIMRRLWQLLPILILTLLAGILTALPAELQTMPLPPNPDLLSGTLDNGLSYYIMRNAKPEHRAELRLFVNVGSVNEDEDQRGLAHFTEHMVFNGTKNFEKSQVVDYLSSIGMGYYNGLNGFTTRDFTVYMFKVPTDNEEQLRKGMLILSDMAHQVSFDTEEIERERGVIIEEWRMGQDAQNRIAEKEDAVNYAGSRYADRSPIGTYEVLSGFAPETLKRFYQDWYRPDLQSVVIVGDFEPEAMKALVEEYFGPIPAPEDPRPLETFTVPENLTPQAVVATDPEYPMNILTVMWKKPVEPLATLGDYHEKLKQRLFYTMLNTRLEEQSKKPDPPFSFAVSYDYPLLRTLSAAGSMALLTPGKGSEALTTILTEAERVQRYGFLPSEFERAKIELKRRAEQEVAEKGTRESEDITWNMLGLLTHKEAYLSPEQEQGLINAMVDEISLEEVNAIVNRMIQEKNMFISLAGPEKPGTVYPGTDDLLAVASTVAQAEIEPYEDKTVDQPIMALIPKPGKIRKQSYDKKTGIRKWVLSNGVTVYSKKTDFKNDEVLLSAVSPGGSVQFGPELVPAANLLGWFVSESGFGDFDSVSLAKATIGKVAQAEMNVDLHSDGLDASCSPQDMELMFQLIYQHATNPRFDEQDFASFRARSRAFYEDRMLDPQNVFFEKLNSAIYDDSPYRKGLTAEAIDALQLGQMQTVFRDRFADFSDFSFVVVGNFDEDALKQMALTYLANLPSRKKTDKIPDRGFRAVKGMKDIRFQKGESDRCYAGFVTSGEYRYTPDGSVKMNALSLVLNEKLRENIREARSGVYFIQGWFGVERFPKPEYTLQIVMACSPARVDELSEAVYATLDSIRAGLVDDKYVNSARATLEKRYEESIRSNTYWLYNVQNNVWLKRPLTGFLDYPRYHSALDKAAIVKAANQYLSFDRNRLNVIMLPEETKEAEE